MPAETSHRRVKETAARRSFPFRPQPLPVGRPEAGWNVTIQSSAFAYSGSNSGTAIPASNFEIASAAAPTMTAGEAVDATNGPKVPATSPVGTLETARKVLQASA